MSPLFYEDSLGEKLAEKARAAMDAARDCDEELVDDPDALARAEAEVARVDPQDDYEHVTADWVAVLDPSKLSGLMDVAGFNGWLLTAPLEAAGVPHCWDPYPPEDMPGFRVGYGAVDRPFTLLVPADRLAEAQSLLRAELGAKKASSDLPPVWPTRRGLKPPARTGRGPSSGSSWGSMCSCTSRTDCSHCWVS